MTEQNNITASFQTMNFFIVEVWTVKFYLKNILSKLKVSLDTLMEEVIPVVREKVEFE